MTDVDLRAYATAVARYGLPGAEAPAPLGEDAWSLALTTMAEEKVVGIATAAADEGWLPVTDDQYEDLLARQRDAMAWCLGLELRLLQIADAFDAEGIDFIVLKGPALAHTVYPDPSWRTFSDLDLLVRTSQWGSACRVLQEGFGWPRRLPEPRPGFDVRFGKAAVFTTETGQQIDLHRNLVQGPFGVWMTPDEFFVRSVAFSVAGRPFPRLSDEDSLIHAVVHAILGDARPRQMQLRDIDETIRAGSIDIASLSDIVARWRLSAVLGIARRMMSDFHPMGRPPLADTGNTPARVGESDVMKAYGTSGHSVRAQLAMIRALPTLRDRVAYITCIAFPGAAFLRARSGSADLTARLTRLLGVSPTSGASARKRRSSIPS